MESARTSTFATLPLLSLKTSPVPVLISPISHLDRLSFSRFSDRSRNLRPVELGFSPEYLLTNGEIKKRMASVERELEEQLKEAGSRLLQPPASVDELLPLLDTVDLDFLNTTESYKLFCQRIIVGDIMECVCRAPDTPYDGQWLK